MGKEPTFRKPGTPLPDSNPSTAAEAYLREQHGRCGLIFRPEPYRLEGIRKLQRHGRWYRWTGEAYEQADEQEVEGDLLAWMHPQTVLNGKGEPRPLSTRTHTINGVIRWLKHLTRAGEPVKRRGVRYC